MRKSQWVAVSAALLATAVALSGCTGGGGGAASAGGKTVKYMISQPDTPAELNAVKADLKRFETASGVTVKLDVVPGDSMRTLLQTRLRSGNGPDLFTYGPGPGMAGALAKAGLLYDLTDSYKKYDWPIYDWAKPGVTYQGKLYGLPDQIEQVGVFYNKDLFTKLGIAEPKTIDDLSAAAATIKSAGVIPFATGNKEAWEGGHLLSMSLASQVGSKESAKLVQNKSSWTSDGVVEALSVWDRFRQAGYLPPTPNAVSYDNSNALFYSGKAAMDPTGTWLIQDFAKTISFKVGFIPFPAPDGKGIFSTDVGGGNFMSATSKNTVSTIKLLNYLASQQHGQWEVAQYNIPAFPVKAPVDGVDPLFQKVVADNADFARGSTDVGYNIDVNETDLFNKAMYDNMQGLLGGTSTPKQVAQALQTAATTK
jgi:raffinose/stachyose/melibiose transport system substrate-binding protein